MAGNRINTAKEIFYYVVIGLIILLSVVAVSVAIIPGITKEKYISCALSLSLLVSLVCIVLWIGHHLEIKKLNSVLSKLIWTGLIAGLIAPIPTVIMKGNQSEIKFDQIAILDPTYVRYRESDNGRPFLSEYIPLLGNIISFSPTAKTAIPILFTVKGFSSDLDGKPNITFSVIVKNKQTNYAVAEDFPEPITKLEIAGDAFMDADTMKKIKSKYGLLSNSCGVFMILDQLQEKINVSGEILIRVFAKDNITGQSTYFDRMINLKRE